MLGILDLKKIGERLAMVDHHLFAILKKRLETASLVAEAKKQKNSGPIRRDVEDERITLANKWAKNYDFDHNFATSILYLLIAESCRTQSELSFKFDKEKTLIDEKNTETVFQFKRKELMKLTKAIAPYYDKDYGPGFFGTETYLNFEKGEIKKLIGKLEDDGETGLAIDLGCATGLKTFLLAESFKKVIGFDISLDMLKIANQKLKSNKKISFKKTDLEKGIPLDDNTVSMVVMNFGTASDIRNIDRLISEIKRVLKIGGRYFLSFYNADSLLSNFGFLPWPTSLAATIDKEKNTLDVRVGTRIYLIHAQPFSVSEVREKIEKQGLKIKGVLTHPTVSSIVPEDILSIETFVSNADISEKKRAKPPEIKCIENKMAKNNLAELDEGLATSPLNLGAYIIAQGKKE